MFRFITAFAKQNKLAYIHPIEKICLCIFPVFILGFAKTMLPILMNILLFIFLHWINKNPYPIVKRFILGVLIFSSMSTVTFLFDYGIQYCLLILMKTVSGALSLSYFVLTTPIDDVLYIMAKNKFFTEICDIIKVMERFVILIEEESGILYQALKVRGGFDSFFLRIRSTGKMAGILFIHTMRRWRQIKQGIYSRCYNGALSYMNKDFYFSRHRFYSICLYNLMIMVLAIMTLRV